MGVVELCHLPWLGRVWGGIWGKWSLLLSQIDWMVPEAHRQNCRKKGKKEVGVNLGLVLNVSWDLGPALTLCQSHAVLPSQWAQAGTLTPCRHPSSLFPELHLTVLTLPYLSLYLLLLILSNHLWPPGWMSQFYPDSRHCQCLSPPHLWHLRFWSIHRQRPNPFVELKAAPGTGVGWEGAGQGWHGRSMENWEGDTCRISEPGSRFKILF